MAEFEIQLRINTVYLDGLKKRGSWGTFKKYKSFRSLIDAWIEYSNRKGITSSVSQNGVHLYDFEHQYRPIFKEEKQETPKLLTKDKL